MMNTQDPKAMVAQQLGQLIIANLEQAAIIERQAAEIERLTKAAHPESPPKSVPSMDQAA